MCFVFISEQIAASSPYNMNWVVVYNRDEKNYCEVRTGSLNNDGCAASIRKNTAEVPTILTKTSQYPKENYVFGWLPELVSLSTCHLKKKHNMEQWWNNTDSKPKYLDNNLAERCTVDRHSPTKWSGTEPESYVQRQFKMNYIEMFRPYL